MNGKFKVTWYISKMCVCKGDSTEVIPGPDIVELSISIDEVTPKNSSLLADLFNKLGRTMDGKLRWKPPKI